SWEYGFGRDSSGIRYAIADSSGRRVATVAGTLQLNELTGGLRYSVGLFRGDEIHTYLRAGYAYTWYAARQMSVAGEPLNEGKRKGGYAPTLWPSRKWWPNTWYAGGGVEWFSPEKSWLLGKLGYGMRLEFTGLRHRVRSDHAPARAELDAVRGDVALAMILGW
ncbi:MAG: hypothetical protein HY561_09740, partial [Gemmatimonadetes bacterium]|nr:hypothetical protein [Gemmatimonadota bacterium]